MKTFWQRISPEMGLKLINMWPPYLGAGIKVRKLEDKRKVVVEMKQTIFNTNYVGVHFGGSLYSMCDPFFMLLLMMNLGKEYIVWDKKAEIDFVKPGAGLVIAEFIVTEEEINHIKRTVEEETKCLPTFKTRISDRNGDTVAKIIKTLYVRKKT